MRLLVVGAGGHASVVIDAAEQSGWQIAGVIGRASDQPEILGHAISSSTEGIDADAYIIAIGDNATRARYFQEYRDNGLAPATVIHPSAVIARSAEIAAGTFIAAGVVVNPLATIGQNAILNTGCIVEHHVRVGDHAHVGPNASLCGMSGIGDGVLFGVGASLRPGATVGEWTTIGAGAAVASDLPARMVCVGVPARPIRAVES